MACSPGRSQAALSEQVRWNRMVQGGDVPIILSPAYDHPLLPTTTAEIPDPQYTRSAQQWFNQLPDDTARAIIAVRKSMVREQALNMAALNAPAPTRRSMAEPSSGMVPTTAFLQHPTSSGQPAAHQQQQQRLHAQGQRQQQQWGQEQPPGTPVLSGRPPPLEQQHLQRHALSHQQKELVQQHQQQQQQQQQQPQHHWQQRPAAVQYPQQLRRHSCRIKTQDNSSFHSSSNSSSSKAQVILPEGFPQVKEVLSSSKLRHLQALGCHACSAQPVPSNPAAPTSPSVSAGAAPQQSIYPSPWEMQQQMQIQQTQQQQQQQGQSHQYPPVTGRQSLGTDPPTQQGYGLPAETSTPPRPFFNHNQQAPHASQPIGVQGRPLFGLQSEQQQAGLLPSTQQSRGQAPNGPPLMPTQMSYNQQLLQPQQLAQQQQQQPLQQPQAYAGLPPNQQLSNNSIQQQPVLVPHHQNLQMQQQQNAFGAAGYPPRQQQEYDQMMHQQQLQMPTDGRPIKTQLDQYGRPRLEVPSHTLNEQHLQQTSPNQEQFGLGADTQQSVGQGTHAHSHASGSQQQQQQQQQPAGHQGRHTQQPQGPRGGAPTGAGMFAGTAAAAHSQGHQHAVNPQAVPSSFGLAADTRSMNPEDGDSMPSASPGLADYVLTADAGDQHAGSFSAPSVQHQHTGQHTSGGPPYFNRTSTA
ncbi:MAG: hypothetical protein WDW38_003024 [Sanguina aurantia]